MSLQTSNVVRSPSVGGVKLRPTVTGLFTSIKRIFKPGNGGDMTTAAIQKTGTVAEKSVNFVLDMLRATTRPLLSVSEATATVANSAAAGVTSGVKTLIVVVGAVFLLALFFYIRPILPGRR